MLQISGAKCLLERGHVISKGRVNEGQAMELLEYFVEVIANMGRHIERQFFHLVDKLFQL
jgi:hypothetical protein